MQAAKVLIHVAIPFRARSKAGRSVHSHKPCVYPYCVTAVARYCKRKGFGLIDDVNSSQLGEAQ